MTEKSPGRIRAIVLLLAGQLALGLAANFCFKEGGTDVACRLHYFIGGNLCGILSTVLLMGLYARMNVNVAMVLATSGGFLLMQAAFWMAYQTRLTTVQIGGILMVAAGIMLASMPRPSRAVTAEQAASREAAP